MTSETISALIFVIFRALLSTFAGSVWLGYGPGSQMTVAGQVLELSKLAARRLPSFGLTRS